jgi:hypothetical protein
MYGPVRTVVWQGSAGDRRPYADPSIRKYHATRHQFHTRLAPDRRKNRPAFVLCRLIPMCC